MFLLTILFTNTQIQLFLNVDILASFNYQIKFINKYIYKSESAFIVLSIYFQLQKNNKKFSLK